MRCECCNNILTDLEQDIIFTVSGVAANTCTPCLKTMDVAYSLPLANEDNDYIDVFPIYEEEPPLYDEDELWGDR